MRINGGQIMHKFFFILIILFLFSSSYVFAISLTPSEIKSDFEEGNTISFELTVRNKGGDTRVAMSTEGSEEYIEDIIFEPSEFVLKAGASQKVKFSAKYKTYDDLTKYGRQNMWIRAQEITEGNGGGFKAVTAVSGLFRTFINYPGKYGQIINFRGYNVKEGLDTKITFTLVGKGKTPLDNAKMQLSVFNFDGEKVLSKSFDNIKLGENEQKEYEILINSNKYPPGRYTATAEFYYDPPNVAKDDIAFYVGTQDIEIVAHTEEINKDTINKISLVIRSMWNDPMRNIRGEISYLGKTEKLPVIDLEGFEQKDIETYIDLIGHTDLNNLDATLLLKFPLVEGGFVEKEFPISFIVNEKSLVVEVEEEIPSGGENHTVSILIVISILSLALAINVIFLLKKKKN